MASIESVTGPIAAEDLGVTLIHEHLRARDEANAIQFPHIYDDAALEQTALEAAQAAVDRGVKTIGEPTAMFLGRDVEFIERVATQAGLQAIVCTGIYTYDYLPLFWRSRDADVMADAFVRDIEEGIQGTSIKAAFLKCAADEPGVNENVEKVHRACARASLRTGVPIMAHSRPASNTGPRQLEIFLEEGVDPAKIQIAHCGDTDDLGYIETLLEAGAYVGLDRFGIEMYLADGQAHRHCARPARARLRRAHVPVGRLLRHARLVSGRDGGAVHGGGRSEGLDHHARARPGDSGVARGRHDRRPAHDDDGGQPAALAVA